MPVSVGAPRDIRGLSDIVKNPIYSTGVGLLLYGRDHERQLESRGQGRTDGRSLWERIKSWFDENL
jgi:cell division protein FtsA